MYLYHIVVLDTHINLKIVYINNKQSFLLCFKAILFVQNNSKPFDM